MEKVNSASHDHCVYAYTFNSISHDQLITMASLHTFTVCLLDTVYSDFHKM